MADSGQHASNAPAMVEGSGAAAAGPRSTVGFVGLFALVVSAMVGGGIFSLPQNMAQHASAGGQIVAWAITGVGMWFIVNTFRVLTHVKPHMQDGLYSYARSGFGDFVGFLVAYGYWLCNCFSLVAYGVLIMSTLDIFMPGTFTNGNNVAATIGSSLILWLMLAVALLGTKTGALINVAGTVCKIIPVIVFVVALAAVFKTGVFLRGFWGLGAQGTPLGFDVHRIGAQVSDSMLVTLWLFIGMEGAVVVSGSARHPRDVSRATTAGYLTVLVLYILVSLLPLGVYSSGQVARMPNPSMSVIMEQCFGQGGQCRRDHLRGVRMARLDDHDQPDAVVCRARWHLPEVLPRHQPLRRPIHRPGVDRRHLPAAAHSLPFRQRRRLGCHDLHHLGHGDAMLPAVLRVSVENRRT